MLHELWSWRSKPLINTYFHGVYELSMGEREVIRGNYIFVYNYESVFVRDNYLYFHMVNTLYTYIIYLLA